METMAKRDGNKGGVFLGENEGSETESTNELSGMEHQVVSYLSPVKSNSDHIVEAVSTPKSYPETGHKHLEISRGESSNTFNIPKAINKSTVDHGVTVNCYDTETKKQDESSVVGETDVPEFAVVTVIEKQETHDLICPNCKSCITKSVILVPRTTPGPGTPDLFQCLSCLCIFSTMGVVQLDIIKSIVYGGLLESIASVSVVTSAAGANTSTLNVLALGAANMLGGLFVLAHNLRALKNESTNNERYEEALGRRGHFTLHSTLAVLSYLVFGLMPPLIYGFTFRESDNRDYKLIAVASASLVCITMLSLGKAYTRTHPKSYMKTLFYYLGLWVTGCGVSFVAGDLIDMLLEKLGLFESTSSVGEVRPLNTPWPWTSY